MRWVSRGQHLFRYCLIVSSVQQRIPDASLLDLRIQSETPPDAWAVSRLRKCFFCISIVNIITALSIYWQIFLGRQLGTVLESYDHTPTLYQTPVTHPSSPDSSALLLS
jgi:hypothetical protein